MEIVIKTSFQCGKRGEINGNNQQLDQLKKEDLGLKKSPTFIIIIDRTKLATRQATRCDAIRSVNTKGVANEED